MLETFLFGKHLEDDENVRLVVHKHWLLGLRRLAWPTIFFLIAWFVLLLEHSPPAIAIVGLCAGLAVLWWIHNFLDYYLDAWIVTDHGIIDLEWHGWFHRQSSRILYSDIQGVSTEIHGIAGTLLRYGTVSIEKISTGAAIAIESVPHPRIVESVILQNMENYLHNKNLKNAKHIEELLSKFVAVHIQEDTFGPGKKSAEPPPDAKLNGRTTKTSFTSTKIGSPKR
ncbi:hypothetical protein EXS70_02870 [Candidatus Peribacteria bacterium]|nr:hypothetical protein [Candidatus Peribacteria bacterium]